MDRKLTFDNMIPAMKKYAAVKTILYDELDRMASTGCVTDHEFTAWDEKRKANERDIQEAYYLDTSDRNSRNTVAITAADSLIALANKILCSRNSEAMVEHDVPIEEEHPRYVVVDRIDGKVTNTDLIK